MPNPRDTTRQKRISCHQTKKRNPGPSSYQYQQFLSESDSQRRLELQYRALRSNAAELLPKGLTLLDRDSILDAGTGTGIWLNDVAAIVSPSISLVGIDIESRLFPPPLHNQTFAIQSSLSLPTEWTRKFAFVHQSLMALAFSADAWKTCIEGYFRVLRPGGMIQLRELDILWSMRADVDLPPLTTRARDALKALCAFRKIDPDMFPKIAGLLEAAGFVDVRAEVVDVPLAVDGKGTDALRSSIEAWRAMKGAAVKLGGLGMADTEEGFDAFLDDMAAEWRKTSHSLPYIIWTATKPL